MRISSVDHRQNWRRAENQLVLSERRSGDQNKKRNFMKKNVFIFIVVGILFSNTGVAEDLDAVVYSTEGYCILANDGVSDDYLKAYSKKLGTTPSARVCDSFKVIIAESRPKDWDYPAGRAYPGSVITLSPSQVALLKSLKKAE
jgi:hypothetical protein